MIGSFYTEKEKAPEDIYAKNDSLAYVEAYTRWCISLEVWNKMAAKDGGVLLPIPVGFKLYNANEREIYVAIHPEKLKDIEDRVKALAHKDENGTSEVEHAESSIDSVAIDKLSPFFNFKKDEFDPRGRTWIKPKSAPKYIDMNGIYCYFMRTDDGVSNFRFSVQFYADDWLFIRKCQFLIDGKAYEYIPSNVERDNADGYIWEWFDEKVESSNDIEIIKALAQAKSAKIKFIGRQYYKIRNISEKDILNIRRAVDLYTAMGGVLK